MKQFRLPRKTKKRLKKTFWLFPPDEKGNSLMASPAESFEDYSALKQGVLSPLPDKRNSRPRRREFHEKLNKEIFISDEQLLEYVNEIFRKDLRVSSYNLFIQAKNNKRAVIAYYNFINAYKLYKEGNDSFGNICCMAIDWTKELLKQK